MPFQISPTSPTIYSRTWRLEVHCVAGQPVTHVGGGHRVAHPVDQLPHGHKPHVGLGQRPLNELVGGGGGFLQWAGGWVGGWRTRVSRWVCRGQAKAIPGLPSVQTKYLFVAAVVFSGRGWAQCMCVYVDLVWVGVGGVGWGLIGVGCATAWDEIVGAGHGFLLRLGWGCGSGLPHTRIINHHHPLLLSLALLTQLTLLKPGRAHRDA